MRGLLAGMVLGALLLASLPAVAGEGEVREHVDRYFRDFNEGKEATDLVESYLSAPLTLISSTGVTVKNSKAEAAGWLADIQATLATNGWVRSELLEGRVCMPAENIAVFSAKFARVMNDTRTVHGVTYILSKSDRWRIVSALFVNPGEFLDCDDT